MSQRADLRVTMEGVGGNRRFVIRNIGEVAARSVELNIESENGKVSPLVSLEVDRLIPIVELQPEETCELTAIVTTGTGLQFLADLSWGNPDGSTSTSRSRLAL